MKSFKTLLLLTSVSLLAACGVDTPEAPPGAELASWTSEAVRTVEAEAAGPSYPQSCYGGIHCTNGASTFFIPCSIKEGACTASCPSGTGYDSGSCMWVTPMPPQPQPTPPPQ